MLLFRTRYVNCYADLLVLTKHGNRLVSELSLPLVLLPCFFKRAIHEFSNHDSNDFTDTMAIVGIQDIHLATTLLFCAPDDRKDHTILELSTHTSLLMCCSIRYTSSVHRFKTM